MLKTAAEAHEHTSVRWEYDSTQEHFTIRCPKCGHILSRITLVEARESSSIPPAIKKLLDQLN